MKEFPTWDIAPVGVQYTKITTPTGTQPLHDDRLISAALIAQADDFLRDGRLLIGRAHSIISASYDPLDEPPGEYYDPLEDLPDF